MVGTGFLLSFLGVHVFLSLIPPELFAGCYGVPAEFDLSPLVAKGVAQWVHSEPLI